MTIIVEFKATVCVHQLILLFLVGLARTSHHSSGNEEDQQLTVTIGHRLGTGYPVQQGSRTTRQVSMHGGG